MQLKVVKILLLATLAGICSCQSCTLPTTADLERVLKEILQDDDGSNVPDVTVMRLHPVCLAFDTAQDRYRAVSVVVEYTCTGNVGRCPSGNAVEQIEAECDDGTWSNEVEGSTDFTRSPTPEANFSTSTRQDCAFCVSFELDKESELPFQSPDNVTHCVGESLNTCMCTISIITENCWCIFPQPVTHLAVKVSWDALEQVLVIAVTSTITPCVWMNASVLSSQTLPMSVYVHLGLLDSTVQRVRL